MTFGELPALLKTEFRSVSELFAPPPPPLPEAAANDDDVSSRLMSSLTAADVAAVVPWVTLCSSELVVLALLAAT